MNQAGERQVSRELPKARMYGDPRIAVIMPRPQSCSSAIAIS